jgi:hypothetical protein
LWHRIWRGSSTYQIDSFHGTTTTNSWVGQILTQFTNENLGWSSAVASKDL